MTSGKFAARIVTISPTMPPREQITNISLFRPYRSVERAELWGRDGSENARDDTHEQVNVATFSLHVRLRHSSVISPPHQLG